MRKNTVKVRAVYVLKRRKWGKSDNGNQVLKPLNPGEVTEHTNETGNGKRGIEHLVLRGKKE